MRSAYDNPQVIDYSGKELAMGRVVGPLPCHALPHAHGSPFGVIPESSQPAKWRMIVNLSAPEENSINDSIHEQFCSLTYIKVDVIEQVLRLGPGSMLAKMDVESAYHTVPIHLDGKTSYWGEPERAPL